MRHIASLFAGLIIAPLAWLLIGAGTMGLDPDGMYQGANGKPSTVVAIAMFAAAGILLGLVAVTRLSPLGPLVIAGVFGGCFAVFRFVMTDFALPQALASAKIPPEAAVAAGRSGTVLVIAALMALTIVIPSRWRGKKESDDRVVDTATLGSTSKSSSEESDPFGSSSALGTPSAGTGYDERPADPFASPQSSNSYNNSYGSGYGTSQGDYGQSEQRSPYADDTYAGYEAQSSQQSYSREGSTQQQPYGDQRQTQQQAAQQAYGAQQYR